MAASEYLSSESSANIEEIDIGRGPRLRLVLRLYADDQFPLAIGARKARLILKHITEIKSYLEECDRRSAARKKAGKK